MVLCKMDVTESAGEASTEEQLVKRKVTSSLFPSKEADSERINKARKVERNIKAKNTEINVRMKNSERKAKAKNAVRHVEVKNAERHVEEKNAVRHVEEKNAERHVEEKNAVRHVEEKNAERHVEEKNTVRHVEEKNAERHVEAKSVERHVEAKSAERHVEAKSAERHVEAKSVERHVEAKSAERHVEMTNAEIHVEAKNTEKHVEVKNIERHAVATNNDWHVRANNAGKFFETKNVETEEIEINFVTEYTERNLASENSIWQRKDSKISASDTEDIKDKKLHRSWKKAEKVSDESFLKLDTEPLEFVDKTPIIESEPTKKWRFKKKAEEVSDSSYPKSDNELFEYVNETPKKETDLSKKCRLKRKTEEVNDESFEKSDNELLESVIKIPMEVTEPMKKMVHTYNYSITNSINETFQLKPLIIKLHDFMTNSSADNDQYVAQYKQANGYKDNEESQILDGIGDAAVNPDQKMESDNLDNNRDTEYKQEINNEEDRISIKSHESEDNNLEQDSSISKSTTSNEENTPLRIRKCPRTPSPPFSPVSQGPHTPSLSPIRGNYPIRDRGPRTPPGDVLSAPSSDTEPSDEGDSSESDDSSDDPEMFYRRNYPIRDRGPRTPPGDVLSAPSSDTESSDEGDSSESDDSSDDPEMFYRTANTVPTEELSSVRTQTANFLLGLREADKFCTPGLPVVPEENKFREDFKELFFSKKDCDVVLKVKGQEFPAHQLILKARSPVFAATFRNPMKEKATGIVNIEDCDPSSFSDFLCFLYCADGSCISEENVFSLFKPADKYDVKDLRSKCLNFMRENLSVDTFCDTLLTALQHSETELIQLATEFFIKNAPKIVVTVKWQLFLRDYPTQSNELLVKLLVPNNNVNN